MAQQKELKSPYGQSAKNLPSTVMDEEADLQPVPDSELEGISIVAPGTAIPGTARGLPESQPQQQGFSGPYAPEFYQQQQQPVAQPQGEDLRVPGAYQQMYGIAPESMYTSRLSEKEVNDLIDAGQLGVSVGLGIAFPALGALGVVGTEAALSFMFDSLRNSVNSDAKQIQTPQKIFNAAFSGITAGAGAKASQWLLGKVIGKAAQTGDEAILKEASSLMEKEYGKDSVRAVLSEAEKIGAKLTPEEAFPFDPAAQAVTAEAMKEYPKLGIQLANRIGQYRDSVRKLFAGSEPISGAGNLREFADEAISNYQKQMGSIQKQLNQAGSSVDVRIEGNELLDSVKKQMDKVNIKFEGDVLAGDKAVAPRMSAIMQDLKNKIVAKGSDDFLKGEGRIVSVDKGNILNLRKEPVKLTLNDVESVRSQISDLVNTAYEKQAKNLALTEDERIAKALYGDVARIRDSMNERVANEIGRPELASEVKALRTEYTTKIEALESVRDKLSKEPVDQLKYLFNKSNAEEAGKIVSVLSPEQRAGLKSEFVNRLIDPVTLREMGIEGGDKTLSSALNQLKSYDAGVLNAIYTKPELETISRFLEMGKRAETVLAKSKADPEKIGVVKSVVQMLRDPKNGVLKSFLDKLDNKSALKQFADYKLFLSGQRDAGELSADVARKLGAPEAGKLTKAREAIKQAVPQRFKELVPPASQIGGRALGETVRRGPEEETQ